MCGYQGWHEATNNNTCTSADALATIILECASGLVFERLAMRSRFAAVTTWLALDKRRRVEFGVRVLGKLRWPRGHCIKRSNPFRQQ